MEFPGRSRRRTILLALLFAASSGLGAVIYLAGLLWDGEPLWVLDFPSFFMAADAVFNHGLSPYAESTRSAYKHALGFWVLPFLYPPYALPALYPLALVGYTTGMVSALILNTAAAGLLFCLLHRMFLAGIRQPAAYWSALFLVFIGSSVRETIIIGQVNLVAALSLLWAWRLLRNDAQPVLAGLLIGIAIVTKTYFVLLLLLFVARLEWRPVAAALAVVVAFTLASIAFAPLSLWGEWLTDVAPTGRYGTTPFPDLPRLLPGNQSINSALIRVLGEGQIAGVSCLAIISGMLAAVGLLLWRARKVPAMAYFDAMLPLMLVSIYLVAPLSWMHHLLFVIPAVLHLWAVAAASGSRKEMALVGAAAIWIAIPWPLPAIEEISLALTLIPIPGIVGLWVLSLRHAAATVGRTAPAVFPAAGSATAGR